jgi:hypothetical protein
MVSRFEHIGNPSIYNVDAHQMRATVLSPFITTEATLSNGVRLMPHIFIGKAPENMKARCVKV